MRVNKKADNRKSVGLEGNLPSQNYKKTYCDLCDERRLAKKDCGIWVCDECNSRYPK